MSLRDFLIFVLVCAVWALNMIAGKVIIAQFGVPPLYFAMVRSVVIALAVLPWLLPVPRPAWRAFVVGILMGGGGFGLMFLGLQTAAPSSVAVVLQLGVPMVTVLSVLILGERIRWRRGLGIALAVLGVVMVMYDPYGFEFSTGLLFVVAAAFTGALGAVMMKQMEGIRPLRIQAWVGFSSVVMLMPLTLMLEENQIATSLAAGWTFVVIVLFSGLIVSVVAHTIYYGLIQRYEANLIAPLTLMSPLMAIGFGVWLTGDHFDLRKAIGSAIALCGVLIIAIRQKVSPEKGAFLRTRL